MLVADFSHSLVTGRHGRVQRAERQKEGKYELNPRFLTETNTSGGCYLMYFHCLCRAENTRWRRSAASTWRPNWATSKEWSAITTGDPEDPFITLEKSELLDSIVRAQMCWCLSRCVGHCHELCCFQDIWLIMHVNIQSILTHIAQCNIFNVLKSGLANSHQFCSFFVSQISI